MGIFEKYKIPLAIVLGFVILGFMLRGNGSDSNQQDTSLLEETALGQPEQQSSQDEVKGEISSSSKVTAVVDGDTVRLESGQVVRLIGMDAPETNEAYYSESKNKLSELILNRSVRLEKDTSETDRYNRLLRYLYRDNTFINLEMVRLGYAVVYRYPPDVKHAGEFAAAEKEAKDNNSGMWATPKTSTVPDVSAPIPKSSAQAEAQSPNPGFTIPACSSSDCDCGDFATHDYAQWFHENYNPGDRHRLDQDKDGLACETLP